MHFLRHVCTYRLPPPRLNSVSVTAAGELEVVLSPPDSELVYNFDVGAVPASGASLALRFEDGTPTDGGAVRTSCNC